MGALLILSSGPVTALCAKTAAKSGFVPATVLEGAEM